HCPAVQCGVHQPVDSVLDAQPAGHCHELPGRADLQPLAALYGIAPGSELIFGILVLNTGDTFKMGPGGRNPDGVEHVLVDYAEGDGGDVALLGFEDLFGGGDHDYNDANFEIQGGIGFARVSAPASLILLLLGLAALAASSGSILRKSCRQILIPSSK
ncbi:MAG: hypothetical protein DMD77_17740, partial [Candidatus Rokuibacteriota bacterium]